LDSRDCGPACLAMISRFYGKVYSIQTLRERCFITRQGVSMLGISDAAESIGFRTIGARLSLQQLREEATLPCIAHWRQNHFVVVYRITKDTVYVADPGEGIIRYTYQEFLNCWAANKREGEKEGICLLLEPTPEFYKQEGEDSKRRGLGYLFFYLRPHHRFIVQLIVGLLAGSVLQLIFPFLTQSIVDKGINARNIDFVYLVLAAQLMLFFSQTAVEFIRSWIFLHISARVNISLISDFLIKLLKLPIGFFDSKMIGDIMQRIGDHTRIESFLTSSSLSILFSMLNLLIFGVVLVIYNMTIFIVFFLASILYVVWVVVFMKKRRELDFKRFQQLADNQSNLYQLITGIQEIKLNNCEKQKRWDWERIQARLFKVNVKSLSLGQYQQSGALFINQFKNIIISFYAAKGVIDGQMTLGMMMAVQYIIGQLNSPIEQLIGFLHSLQDAKISLERLGEIHQRQDEEKPEEGRTNELLGDHTLTVSGLSFQYEGPHSEKVLQELDLIIPAHKVTAIVGMSGSGKTTLIKLLLGFYPPIAGEIRVGDQRLDTLSPRAWRQLCGVVMQDGFIFSDTIADNIAVSDETIDRPRLAQAVKVANIGDLIETLPLGYNTKIGMEGHGLSQGQKQRILIARAVYKNPDFIFFDEATNALDANNERVIMENMDVFFKGRTVVVVAHRLSTVRHADQIVVLEMGRIVERGSHEELTARRGAYYNLVKNQLELGQ
jgi:ATP-binding cassette subfamily B protein